MNKISLGNESAVPSIEDARLDAIVAHGMGSRTISNDAARAIAGAEYDWSRINVNVFSLIYHGRPFDPAIAIKLLGERLRLLHSPMQITDVRLDPSDVRTISILMLISTLVTLAIEDVVLRSDSQNTVGR